MEEKEKYIAADDLIREALGNTGASMKISYLHVDPIKDDLVPYQRRVQKVKLFRSDDAKKFVEGVNSFIKDRNIIDIQYQAVLHGNIIGDSVLIRYWELEE